MRQVQLLGAAAQSLPMLPRHAKREDKETLVSIH